jgi:membrane-bound serine protease (ClpP class)
LQNACVTAVVAGVALSALVYFSWKFLPRTPLFQGILMTYRQAPETGYVVQTERESAAAVGLKGVATSKLRPAGRGRFGETTYDVVSHSEYIEPGTPIVIVQVDGNRYVVDTIKGA